MSEIYDAMMEHMANIIHIEKRPFYYKDFLSFTVNDKDYKMAYGTIRNYFCKLKKDEEIELVYNSGTAYYTLKGMSVGKQITPNHIGISYNHPFYCLIQDLPLDKVSIHNIHLRFEVKDIWSMFYNKPSFEMNPQSKDIKLAEWRFDKDVFVTVTVHRTNTVTVIIGCSLRPFPLNFQGISNLVELLTRIEERLSSLPYRILGQSERDIINHSTFTVPSYKDWIVKMWHIGADSLRRYSGESISLKWEIAQNVIIQIYSKKFRDGKRRIRMERQEYPNDKILNLVEEKLSHNNYSYQQ